MHKADERTAAIHRVPSRDQMHPTQVVENAYGQAAGALLDTLDAECGNIRQLEANMVRLFRIHPDYRIMPCAARS